MCSEAWRQGGGMVSDHHRSVAGMCLVTIDLCSGRGLGDDERVEWKGWDNGDRLGDLNFADIVLLENPWKGMKDPTDRTQKEMAKYWLNINPEKTKIMKVRKWNEAEGEEIMIDGREVESVDAFLLAGLSIGG